MIVCRLFYLMEIGVLAYELSISLYFIIWNTLSYRKYEQSSSFQSNNA